MDKENKMYALKFIHTITKNLPLINHFIEKYKDEELPDFSHIDEDDVADKKEILEIISYSPHLSHFNLDDATSID
jgi:hypothetical protein